MPPTPSSSSRRHRSLRTEPSVHAPALPLVWLVAHSYARAGSHRRGLRSQQIRRFRRFLKGATTILPMGRVFQRGAISQRGHRVSRPRSFSEPGTWRRGPPARGRIPGGRIAMSTSAFTGPDCRHHKLFVTRNTEYHVRDGRVIAVRKRGESGSGRRRTPRSGSSSRGIWKEIRSCRSPASRTPGDRMYLAEGQREVFTTTVVAKERPPRETVEAYPSKDPPKRSSKIRCLGRRWIGVPKAPLREQPSALDEAIGPPRTRSSR